MAKHHPDLVMCRKQPGIAIGRLCEKCPWPRRTGLLETDPHDTQTLARQATENA